MAKPLMATIALALILGAFAPRQMAIAADPALCEVYAAKFALTFQSVIGRELNPFYQEKALSHCILVDEIPEGLPLPSGTIPASETPSGANTGRDMGTVPPMSAWETTCRRRYQTFDVKDGSVIRYGTHKRVPCPVKK